MQDIIESSLTTARRRFVGKVFMLVPPAVLIGYILLSRLGSVPINEVTGAILQQESVFSACLSLLTVGPGALFLLPVLAGTWMFRWPVSVWSTLYASTSLVPFALLMPLLFVELPKLPLVAVLIGAFLPFVLFGLLLSVSTERRTFLSALAPAVLGACALLLPLF